MVGNASGGSTAQRVQRMAVAAGIDVHIIVTHEVPIEVSRPRQGPTVSDSG